MQRHLYVCVVLQDKLVYLRNQPLLTLQCTSTSMLNSSLLIGHYTQLFKAFKFKKSFIHVQTRASLVMSICSHLLGKARGARKGKEALQRQWGLFADFCTRIAEENFSSARCLSRFCAGRSWALPQNCVLATHRRRAGHTHSLCARHTLEKCQALTLVCQPHHSKVVGTIPC